MRISSELHQQLLDFAARDASVETCALLFGAALKVTAFAETPNVAPDPICAFEIDPASLIAAHRSERRGGPALVGVFHSHPNGRAGPSPDDVAAAAPNGWIWMIAAGGSMTAWQADVQGGFTPLAIEFV